MSISTTILIAKMFDNDIRNDEYVIRVSGVCAVMCDEWGTGAQGAVVFIIKDSRSLAAVA